MGDYAEAIVVGIGVGVIYGILRFRSPAPPLLALVGLLGMLIGEQLVTTLRSQLWPLSPAPASVEQKLAHAAENTSPKT